MNTLIEHGWLVCVNAEQDIYRDSYAWVEDGRIAALGPMAQIPAGLREQADQILNATGQAVMPGMVNAHTHLFQTFLRGVCDDLPLETWPDRMIRRDAALLTEEDFHLAASLGCVENLKPGATFVVEDHYVQTSKHNCDRVFEVLVNPQRAHIALVHWAESALVFNCNGSDVETVLVNGEIVVEQGRCVRVDEARLVAQARIEELRSTICQNAGV